MSLILEEREMERLVINEAYMRHHDSVLTGVSLIIIPLLVGCLVIAFIVLRKPAKKLTV